MNRANVVDAPPAAWRSRPAISSSTGETVVTYSALHSAADRLAVRLARRGVCSGTLVGAVLPNGPGFAVSLLAVWRLGAVYAPINPRLTAVERERIVALTRPHAVLLDGPGGDVIEDEDSARPEAPGHRPDLHDAALVLFTSGSTGEPKGVVLSAQNVQAGVEAVLGTFALSEEDRTAALLPWTHGHGLFASLLATLATGGSIAVGGPMRDALRLADPTWLTVVPPLLARLCEQGANPAPGLRFVRTASAALPTPLAERAESLFGCPVAEAYGMTETSHQACANPPDRSGRRHGTVGTPTGLEIRLADPGPEIEVRGPAVSHRYLSGDAVSSPAGWYRTGDVGVVEADGCVRLLGRSSGFINRNGNKVWPAEIENAACEHPDVVTALAVAVPVEGIGEDIGLLVVGRTAADLTEESLRRHLADRLAVFKLPGIIRICRQLPALPNGKPDRALAVRWLAR